LKPEFQIQPQKQSHSNGYWTKPQYHAVRHLTPGSVFAKKISTLFMLDLLCDISWCKGHRKLQTLKLIINSNLKAIKNSKLKTKLQMSASDFK